MANQLSSLNIPLVTLPVGVRTFGPGSIPDADVSITLAIDRTVASGLNSLTSASTLAVTVDQSNDGGTTWQNLSGASWTGGPQTDKHLNPRTQEVLLTELNPGTSRKVRATVTVGGTSIAVSGSLATA